MYHKIFYILSYPTHETTQISSSAVSEMNERTFYDFNNIFTGKIRILSLTDPELAIVDFCEYGKQKILFYEKLYQNQLFFDV